MFKLFVILFNILYLIQIVTCNQSVSDNNAPPNRSNQSDTDNLLESMQLFDKLKKLEVVTLENIKRLNILSNDEMNAKTEICQNYQTEFKKELESIQATVKPILDNGHELENCSFETAKEFDQVYTDEKSYLNILLVESQIQQNKIITNYTRRIENYFNECIEEFGMLFLDPEPMNNTELSTFIKSFGNFLIDINDKVDSGYTAAGMDMEITTLVFQKNLDKKLIQLKDRLKIIVENFENCAKLVNV